MIRSASIVLVMSLFLASCSVLDSIANGSFVTIVSHTSAATPASEPIQNGPSPEDLESQTQRSREAVRVTLRPLASDAGTPAPQRSRPTDTAPTPTHPAPAPSVSATITHSKALATAVLLPTEPPIPNALPTATHWPTVTRQILPADVAAGLPPCRDRLVTNDLLIVVTNQYSLPGSYAPANLVALADHFPPDLTRNQDLYVRSILIEPLRILLGEMHASGLQPSILSGYRSYQEQQLAWHWWETKYPERVAIISARPGMSEHQLGTTVDFGSPSLNHLFNLDFKSTPEGIWLAENAHRFGFTLSFPPGSYAVTGFQYEPWHFRYVGQEMAANLKSAGMILSEWQLANLPPPCVP